MDRSFRWFDREFVEFQQEFSSEGSGVGHDGHTDNQMRGEAQPDGRVPIRESSMVSGDIVKLWQCLASNRLLCSVARTWTEASAKAIRSAQAKKQERERRARKMNYQALREGRVQGGGIDRASDAMGGGGVLN